ncbi:hypothetical protein GN956_G25443 [Arapaima gigas]
MRIMWREDPACWSRGLQTAARCPSDVKPLQCRTVLFTADIFQPRPKCAAAKGRETVRISAAEKRRRRDVQVLRRLKNSTFSTCPTRVSTSSRQLRKELDEWSPPCGPGVILRNRKHCLSV